MFELQISKIAKHYSRHKAFDLIDTHMSTSMVDEMLGTPHGALISYFQSTDVFDDQN